MSGSEISTTKAPAPRTAKPGGESRAGLVSGFTAYALWGVFPIYFKALSDISPWRILCHRVFWSVLFLTLVVTYRRGWADFRSAVGSLRAVGLLALAAVLIATNWLVFIYAITTGRALEASLGYFINPLVSVALGLVFHRERLRPAKWLAVGIAAAGVFNLAIRSASLPWIAVSLALSFGFYGLVRKTVNVNPLHGLLVETSVLFPFAAATLALTPHPSTTATTFALLASSGVLTAVPLILFGIAVRELKLSTLGFLQYIGPTLQFLVAIFLFHEPLNDVRLASFALCWLAIGIYVVDSLVCRQAGPVVEQPD